MLSMDNINTTYKYIITSSVLNIVLQRVDMLWVIKTNQHFEYYMDKHDSDWIKGCPWYNTYICKNYTEKCLKNSL